MASLDAARLRAIAIANRLRGPAQVAALVQSVLGTLPDPVVLVGHSHGGAVIGEAARGAANVGSPVFVAAHIVEEGESIATAMDENCFP